MMGKNDKNLLNLSENKESLKEDKKVKSGFKEKFGKTFDVACIFVIVLLIGGISFAIWKYNFEGSLNLLGDTGIELKFLESNDNVIDIQGALPMSDSEGMESSDVFEFAVTSKSKERMDYYITLEKLSVDSGYDFLDDEYMKLYLTDYDDNELLKSTVKGLGKTFLLYSGVHEHSVNKPTIASKFKLRVWIDERAQNDSKYNFKSSRQKLQYKFKLNVGTEEPQTPELDKSGANAPVLSENMIPVYYDESGKVWKKADSANEIESNQWYDYDSQMWANSVTVSSANRSTYLNAEPGTTIPMDDILTMQVWIPRYKYKIFNYNQNGTTYVPQQEIEVVFESGKTSTGDISCTDDIKLQINNASSEKTHTSEICKQKENNAICTDSTCNEKYYTHPAFTFGSDELAGIWVGKFEVTGSIDEITTKPGITSVRNEIISSFFNNIITMNASSNKYGFDINDDTHMIKNMEWGAVAYLAASKYGKQGNNMYTGANKEIYQNKSSDYITGSSNGTPSTDVINTQCSYNVLIDRGGGTGSCGGGASTTGNISGIYDMSGGASDQMMALLVIPQGDIESFLMASLHFSAPYPEHKYYDRYSSFIGRTISAFKLGDAGKEVMSEEYYAWYDDNVYLFDGIQPPHPEFRRGVGHNDDDLSGIYSIYTGDSRASESNSTRFVISQLS